MPRDIRDENPADWFGPATASVGAVMTDARDANPAEWFGAPGAGVGAAAATPLRAEPTRPGADALRVASQLPAAAWDTLKSVPGAVGGMISRAMASPPRNDGLMGNWRPSALIAPPEEIQAIADQFSPEDVAAYRQRIGTPQALAMPENRLREFMARESSGQGTITAGASTPTDPRGAIARNVQDFGQGIVSAGIRQPAAAVSSTIGHVLASAGSTEAADPFFENAREVGARGQPGDSVGGFLGQTAGSIAPSATALALGPAGPALVASYYGVQGFGTGVQIARDSALARGEEYNPVEGAIVGMGFAAVESVTEKLGFEQIAQRLPNLDFAFKAFKSNPTAAGAKAILEQTYKLGLAGAAEEGSSQLGQNIIQRGADGQTSPLEGVGQAMAGGALGNLMLGGGQIARSGLAGAYDAATQNWAQRTTQPPTPPQAPEGPQTSPDLGGTQDAPQVLPVAPPAAPPESAPVAPPMQDPPTPPPSPLVEPAGDKGPAPSFGEGTPDARKGDRAWPERPPITGPVVKGRQATLRLADGRDRAITYDVVEAEDLIPTHDPRNGFAPNPSGDLNERQYQDPTEGKDGRKRVLEYAQDLKPDFLLTDTPVATDGPPITNADLRVLGGNARSMSIQLGYATHPESAQRYRDALMQRAQGFGIDPASIEQMRQPVLIRRIVGDVGGRGAMTRVLNDSLTGGKTTATQAVSRGLQLEQGDTDAIAGVIGDGTMREALSDVTRANKILGVMRAAGAISESELQGLRNDDGTLTDAGKSTIETALLGAAVADVRTLAASGAQTRQKLLSALGPLTRLRRSAGASSDLDFQGTLARAMDVLADRRESGARSIDDLISQSSLTVQEWRKDPRAIALARSLYDDGPKTFATKLDQLATTIAEVGGGQEGFAFGQPKTPGEAFDQAFGTTAIAASSAASSSQPAPFQAEPVEVYKGTWIRRDANGVKGDPETGKPIEVKGYRGTGRADKDSAYNAGADGPVLGPGRYFAISSEAAQAYGPKVEEATLRLKNPLVITHDAQLAELLGGKIPWSNEEMSKALPAMRAKVTAAGHDGVVVNVTQDPYSDTDHHGRVAKKLRNLFDVSQVFVSNAKVKDVVAKPAGDSMSNAPTSRSGPDVAGQGGLYGQGNVARATGAQRSLFDAAPENAQLGRLPGESDADYRLRIRWTKPDVVAGTGNLFGGERMSSSPDSADNDPDTYVEPLRPTRDPDGVLRVASDTLGTTKKLGWMRKRARRWSLANLHGTSVVNKETGRSITFAVTGIKHSVSTNNDLDALRAMVALPELVAEATLVGTDPPAPDSDQRNLVAVRRFENRVRIGDAEYTVAIHAKEFDVSKWSSFTVDRVDVFYHHSLKKSVEGPAGQRGKDPQADPSRIPNPERRQGGAVLSGPSTDASIDPGTPPVKENDRMTEAPAPVVGDSAVKPDPNQVFNQPRRKATGEPTPMKAGTKGEGTALPEERTVAQGAEDRPARVARDVKQIRNALIRARREGTTESLDPHHRSFRAIIEELSGALNMGRPGQGRHGRLRKKALGFYRVLKGDIRLRNNSDVRTAVHEIGHALAETLLPDAVDLRRRGRNDMTSVYPAAWRQELGRLGLELYGPKEPHNGYVDEGWAEFVAYLTTDPKTLKEKVPTVYRDVVTSLITEHPAVWNALMRARARLAVLKALDSPISPYMYSPVQNKGKTISERYSDAMIRWVDRHYRALDLIRDLGINPGADRDPHLAALRMNGHISGDVKTLLEVGGPWDTSDPTHIRPAMYENAAGETKPIPSLQEILKPVWGNLDAFREYMVAKRILEKRSQGFKVGGDAESASIAEFVTKAETFDGFQLAAEQWQAFNEWLVRDYAVGHGLITGNQAEQIIAKNQHYITFRYADPFQGDETIQGGRRGGKFANQGKPFKYFRGGDHYEFLDPIGATMSNITAVVSKARANQVAQQVVGLWDLDVPGIGRWLSKVAQPMQGTKIRGEQMGEAVARQMLARVTDEAKLTDDQFATLASALENLEDTTFWSPKWVDNDPSSHIAMVLNKGKREYYEIKDRRLWELLNRSSLGTEWRQLPGVVHDLLAGTAGVLRAGATSRNPMFFVPNYLRDQVQALIMTDAELKRLPSQLRDRYDGIRAAFASGDLERAFLASGADMSGVAGNYFDRRTFEVNERVLFRRLGVKEKARARGARYATVDTIKSVALLEPFERINERIERLTRMQEFAAVLGDPKNATQERIARAGQAAADVTVDFAKGGSWSKAINQYVPFFNAAIQGTDKFARFVRAHPVQAATGIAGLIIAPTVLALLLNDDNEDYWAKPYQLRDRYWFFPVADDPKGGKFYIRIPRPHVVGLFAVGVERAWASQRGIDPITGKRGDSKPLEGAGQTVLSQLVPPASIAAIMPVLELMSNYDFFRDRPIVAEYEQALPPEEQGYERASEFGRLVSRMIADIPHSPEIVTPSPAGVDHVVRGYFAGLGNAALSTADPFIRAAWNDPLRPPPRPIAPADYYLIKSFIAGPTLGDHQALRRFYDELDRVRAIKTQYNRLDVDAERQREYYARYTYEIDAASSFEKTARRMGKINKQRRGLRSNPPKDVDELARQDRQLLRDLIDEARAAMMRTADLAKSP